MKISGEVPYAFVDEVALLEIGEGGGGGRGGVE